MSGALSFTDANLLQVGGHDFHCRHPAGTTPPGRFAVLKNPDLVENYIGTVRDLRPVRIVELGINRGGSTALLSELARPEKLVAVELNETPVGILDRYITDQGLADVVRPYYGVDQADRNRLAGIMTGEFGPTPIDLVVDDASHLYEETRSSFETLFPLLRPGGLFVIEDWRCQHRFVDGLAVSDDDLSEKQRDAITRRLEEIEAGQVAPDVPLSRLVLELVLARASSTEAVADLRIGADWAVAQRGHGALDAATFRVDDLFEDHFHLLGKRG